MAPFRPSPQGQVRRRWWRAEGHRGRGAGRLLAAGRPRWRADSLATGPSPGEAVLECGASRRGRTDRRPPSDQRPPPPAATPCAKHASWPLWRPGRLAHANPVMRGGWRLAGGRQRGRGFSLHLPPSTLHQLRQCLVQPQVFGKHPNAAREVGVRAAAAVAAPERRGRNRSRRRRGGPQDGAPVRSRQQLLAVGGKRE